MQNDADWTVEVDVDMVRTNGEKDAARGWAGQIQVENDDGTFDDKDAHKWCWRQDWWGWGYYNLAPGADQSVVNKEGNCGVWDESAFDNGFNDYKDSVLDNCNLKQTISYSHETGVVTIVTIVTAKVVHKLVNILLLHIQVVLSHLTRRLKLHSVCYGIWKELTRLILLN